MRTLLKVMILCGLSWTCVGCATQRQHHRSMSFGMTTQQFNQLADVQKRQVMEDYHAQKMPRASTPELTHTSGDLVRAAKENMPAHRVLPSTSPTSSKCYRVKGSVQCSVLAKSPVHHARVGLYS